MRQRPKFRYVFALGLVMTSPGAMAWGALGHRLVGDLAERHLQPSTERAVRDLLAGEPEPTLAGVANWADSLRTTDPDRFRQTARWHYVNLPETSCRYDMARDCGDGQCVVEAINSQRTVLADRSQSHEARRDALKFLVHLVGDVHQPLHAGNHDDKGGNKYEVSLRTDIAPEAYALNRYSNGVMGTNLHAVWDYYILASANLTEAQYAGRLAGIAWPSPVAALGDPAAWASESCGAVDVVDSIHRCTSWIEVISMPSVLWLNSGSASRHIDWRDCWMMGWVRGNDGAHDGAIHPSMLTF